MLPLTPPCADAGGESVADFAACGGGASQAAAVAYRRYGRGCRLGALPEAVKLCCSSANAIFTCSVLGAVPARLRHDAAVAVGWLLVIEPPEDTDPLSTESCILTKKLACAISILTNYIYDVNFQFGRDPRMCSAVHEGCKPTTSQ